MAQINNSLEANNKYANLKYEPQKIHKKRIAGKTVLLVSRWTVRHITNPKRLTRLVDRVRLFVGVRYRRILRRKI